MSYLIYVAAFGTAAVIFLWLRDARIFFRTGLPGTGRLPTGVLHTARSPRWGSRSHGTCRITRSWGSG